jgi:hypothetical protein
MLNKRKNDGDWLLSGIRRLGWLIIIALACPVLLPAQKDVLKIEVSIQPRRLSPGEEGNIVLKLSLEEGIIVSPHPEFIIEFEPIEAIVFPKNFFAASDLKIETLEKDEEEYLDFKQPVKIPFTVSTEAKKGSYILEGRIKYFARSSKEGWLVKNTAKFFAAFSTRSPARKKKS